jgi:DNA-binding MarR family transcriptional regulator
MDKAAKDQLRCALRIVEEFRNLDPDMPVQQLATFLNVALRENPTLIEVGNLTGQTSASTSRNLHALTAVHRSGKPGLDVISIQPDPLDGRFKRANLTTKGQELVRRICAPIARLISKP